MNIPEGVSVPVNMASTTPTSSTQTRIVGQLPLLLSMGQRPATPTTNPVACSTAAPTILTSIPQIQLAGATSQQIIHSSNANLPPGYSYVPVRQLYQAKPMKDPQKKVFVTSINSGPNTKSNQVNLILPNNQNTNQANKSPITSLILPQIGTVSNKGTITGMLVPNNPATTNTNKPAMASLLLPASKYPNIAPNKKVPIPNIIIPQQNMNAKQTNVPNIIRQTNNPNVTGKNVVGIISSPSNATSPQMTSLLLTPNTNTNNKQTPTSVGLILPTSGGSHGIIVPQSTASQTHGLMVPHSTGSQSHGIIVSQSTGTQSHGILVPQSTGCQSQVTNLIISSSAANMPQQNNTPVASLLISNNNSGIATTVASGAMTSLLIPQSSGPSSLVMSTPTTSVASATSNTTILVPVSVGPATSKVLQSVTYAGGKKSIDTSKSLPQREGMQSVLVKPGGEGSYPSLPPPPLQPISSKEACKAVSVVTKAPNGLNVPESLIMTPISDGEPVKTKVEKMTTTMEEMTIERMSTVSTDEKGTSTNFPGKLDERNIQSNIINEPNKPEVNKSTSTPRGGERDEDVVFDGEVTLERLGPDKDVPTKKPLEDDVSIDVVKEVVKPERPKLPPPRYQKPEDLNPMEVLEWDHQGVGKLPGSNIKFRINEYGLELVGDSNKDESSSNSSRRNSDDKPPNPEKSKGPEEGAADKIYCCEGCGCYGLYTEFLLDTRFCSVGCKKIVLARNEVKKKRQDDKLREIRLRRKRRKMRMMAQRAKRGSVDQKSEDVKEDTSEETFPKAWSNKMAELRRVKRPAEGNIKINLENKRSSLHSSENSSTDFTSGDEEDDTSSDKTGPDGNKETSWLNSSGEFMWNTYLRKGCNKAKAAPIRLFKDPFPYGKNSFKVGMKLEGIDPEHQAAISVLTVVQVKGHRLRLHFDGYPDYHDFWANSDSPDIFPPGWCERNNHTLQPPCGYVPVNFSWNVYLKQCRAQPAPKSLFPKSNTPLCPSQFRVGMKLEAVDRKNSSLICVASVGDLIDNRLLIHFDSWGDVYDYWTDPTSPYIHPVGWCEESGHDLTPPNSYKNPSAFSWAEYLKETKSQAAPARAFKPRPPNTFNKGMKLEAVDKRSPAFLRPATVTEVQEFQIKITFDGFPEEFGYWVDDDCPDIHPTGWGQKTGHSITPPPMEEVKAECGTPGCVGDGNIKGGFLIKHTTAALCPYSPQNLNKESHFPDRLCVNPDFFEVPEPSDKNKESNKTSAKSDTAEDSSTDSRIKTRFSSLKEESKEEPIIKTEPEEKTEERIERRGRKRKLPEPEARKESYDKLRRDLICSVIDPGYQPRPEEQENWVKHAAILGHKVNITGGDPRMWNHKQVAAFVNTVIPSRAKLFLDQEIDGEAFLMLTQIDLTKVLELKLGPALKIYNCIILLRQKVVSL